MRVLLLLLAAGVAWRVFLAWPVAHVEASLMSLAFGLTPYAVIVGLGRGARAVAQACAVVVLVVDVATGVAVMRGTSSTAGVAVLLAPLASACVAAIVLGASRVLTRES